MHHRTSSVHHRETGPSRPISTVNDDGNTNSRRIVNRRTGLSPEFVVSSNFLAQPIDIDLDIPEGTSVENPMIPGYFDHSVGTALEMLSFLDHLELRSAVIRIKSEFKNNDPAERIEMVERHAQAVQQLARSSSLKLIFDPFSVALNSDASWGVKTETGALDLAETEALLSSLTQAVALNGGSGVITLGRMQSEVRISAEARKHNSSFELWSFSTNTETRNAYIYSDKIQGVDTGQKILFGNTSEMLLRSLIDVADGSTAIIVKPAESLHLIYALSRLLSSTEELHYFFSTPEVEMLLASDDYLSQRSASITTDLDLFRLQSLRVGVGAYTVSGTSYLDGLLCDARGSDVALGMLHERFLNTTAAAGMRLGPIVDRSVHLWANSSYRFPKI